MQLGPRVYSLLEHNDVDRALSLVQGARVVFETCCVQVTEVGVGLAPGGTEHQLLEPEDLLSLDCACEVADGDPAQLLVDCLDEGNFLFAESVLRFGDRVDGSLRGLAAVEVLHLNLLLILLQFSLLLFLLLALHAVDDLRSDADDGLVLNQRIEVVVHVLQGRDLLREEALLLLHVGLYLLQQHVLSLALVLQHLGEGEVELLNVANLGHLDLELPAL